MRILCGVALGLTLSSVYLWPAIVERPFIDPLFMKTHANYVNNFLFSRPTSSEMRNTLQWTLLQACVLAPLLLACGIKRFTREANQGEFASLRVFRRMCFLAGLIALFMLLRPSAIFWRLPGLEYVMFPMRWLVVATFAASFLLGVEYGFRHERAQLTVADRRQLIGLDAGGDQVLTNSFGAADRQPLIAVEVAA